jgi:hypothetical protein
VNVGVREALNRNRAATLVVTGALTAAAIGFAVYSMFFSSDVLGSSAQGKAFFSVDDGQKWFVDDASKVPPFERDGKQAYRAVVYRCKADGRQFVARLERYDDAARKRIAELVANHGHAQSPAVMTELTQLMHKIEVKRPGDATWVAPTAQTMQAYERIMHPQCPANASHAIEPVIPGS